MHDARAVSAHTVDGWVGRTRSLAREAQALTTVSGTSRGPSPCCSGIQSLDMAIAFGPFQGVSRVLSCSYITSSIFGELLTSWEQRHVNVQ